jgi:DNA end-binding protein Ku
MEKLGKVGIARVVMRTKQYLCAVRPMDHLLVLSTMQFADEIREPSELGLPIRTSTSKREVEMAEQLIEAMTEKFEPKKFKDEYRERVLELIRRKSEGETIEVPESEEAAPKTTNLIEALRASLHRPEHAAGAQGKQHKSARAARRRNHAVRSHRAHRTKTARSHRSA